MTRLLGLAVLMFAFPGVAAAQDRPPGVLTPGGYDVFRAVLDQAKVTPVTTRDLMENTRYDDLIVVIIGNPLTINGFNQPLGFAELVLNRGGAVLIAFDSTIDIRITRESVTQINGRRVAVTDPRLAYEGKLFDPFVVPEDGDEPVFGLFEGLPRVATEHPSFLVLTPNQGFDRRRVLARFPANRSVLQGTDVELDAARHPFAVADAPSRTAAGRVDYRLLVVADHAVFKNSLMAPAPTAGPTDNIVLASRVVEYLQGPEKARKRCVFYENGRVVENFDTVRILLQTDSPEPGLPPLLPLLLGNQQPLVDMANRLADQVQTRDVMNAIALGPDDNPGGQARRLAGFLTGFLVMGSVWAAWFLLRRVWKARQPTDNPPPPFAGGSVTEDRSGGVFDRRQRELVRRNNLYEPVRDALRDLFAAAGAAGGPGVKPPPVDCSPQVRKPAKLREAIHDLWALAYDRPVPVTVRRSQELAPVIERLHRELADGAWRFSENRSEA